MFKTCLTLRSNRLLHITRNMMTDNKRSTRLTTFPHKNNVLYLMRRDQRLHENYAVELGYSLSYETQSQLLFAFQFDTIRMNPRQKTFMTQGFKELEIECAKYNIGMHLIDDVYKFIKKMNIDMVVLDYSPLKEYLSFDEKMKKFCEKQKMGLISCDAHNIVPCQILEKYKKSSKAIKTDLFKVWGSYLTEFVKVEPHKYNKLKPVANAWPAEETENMYEGGYSAGMAQVKDFFENRFKIYAEHRNNPDEDALSGLSPWIHAGQISAQHIVLRAKEKFERKQSENYKSFLNEIFPCKEMSDHFVLHQKDYDSFDGALDWARSTLLAHKKDKRQYIYSKEQLAAAKTHDPLWNAAQRELLQTGKMHGYVRIYWAKQITKWMEDPRDAVRIGLELNDEYSLDGYDPNGYAGVMWSICGSLDQGFMEREITGKIRPKNPIKCPLYIKKWQK